MPGAACCGMPWGYLAYTSRDIGGVHLVTLRHFEHKPCREVKTGPLIPTQRRLAEMEI